MSKPLNLSYLFPKKEFSVSHDSDAPFCYQSKRTVSSSVFPHPSSIPRQFDIDSIEAKIPKFWKLHRDSAGRPLLTRDQVEQLKREIVAERASELSARYTEVMSALTDRLGKSAAVATEVERSRSAHCDNMFL